jgi:glycosyltransferase involved in cell wall biosynthesis
MKIDFYTLGDPYDPDAWSGTFLEMANAFKRLGILQGTYNIKPENLRSIKPGDRIVDKIAIILRNIKYSRYYNGKIYSLSQYHPTIVEASRKSALKIYNSHTNPDAILTHGDYALFDKTPFFIFHDLDIGTLLDWRQRGKNTYMCDSLSISLLKKRLAQQMDAYEKARGLLIASDWIAKNIKLHITEPDKVQSVGIGHKYIPIDLDPSLLERRFEQPCLLFIGRDGIRKGLDIVLSAFDVVKEEIPDAKLEVVTDFNQSSKQIIRRIQNTKGIHADTAVPIEVLNKIYLNSSIFLMPSRFEAWGKVFFEAMSFGLPIMGARNCAMPEFIKDDYNGYTTDYDPFIISDKIIATFGSFEKYKYMSKNALKVCQDYTWENVSKNLVKIISNNLD